MRNLLFLLPWAAAALFAQEACDNLTALKLPDVTITSAKSVVAGPFKAPAGRVTAPGGRAAAPVNLPAFCRVVGYVRPEVNFEAWLPANWNKKFLMVGNGGLAGTISYAAMATPLNRGYATASTDTGHVADTDGHWALGHMERVIDFAHRSVHVTAQASKAIIRAFYGVPPMHSYFNGCSQGGQEALTESQRYPLDFDGIIAGDPANNWTRLSIGAHLWITRALLEEPGSYIPASKTKTIGDAVNAACDALDGIQDGILNNPRRCHFDPSVLLCKNGDAPDCLTAAQVATAKKIYQGARTSAGEQIFPGILPGGEAGRGGWTTWITGTDPERLGTHTTLGSPFWRNIVFEDPNWDVRSFRFDRTQDQDSDVDF